MYQLVEKKKKKNQVRKKYLGSDKLEEQEGYKVKMKKMK